MDDHEGGEVSQGENRKCIDVQAEEPYPSVGDGYRLPQEALEEKLQESRMQITCLHEDLCLARSQLEQASTAIADQKTANSKQAVDLVDISAQLDTAKDALVKVTAERDWYISRFGNQDGVDEKAQAVKAIVTFTDQAAEIERLRNSRNAYSEELRLLQAKLQHREENRGLAGVASELDDARAVFDKSLEKIEELNESIHGEAGYIVQIATLEGEIRDPDGTRSSHLAENAHLRGQLDKTQTQYDALKEKLETVSQERDMLQRKLDETRESLVEKNDTSQPTAVSNFEPFDKHMDALTDAQVISQVLNQELEAVILEEDALQKSKNTLEDSSPKQGNSGAVSRAMNLPAPLDLVPEAGHVDGYDIMEIDWESPTTVSVLASAMKSSTSPTRVCEVENFEAPNAFRNWILDIHAITSIILDMKPRDFAAGQESVQSISSLSLNNANDSDKKIDVDCIAANLEQKKKSDDLKWEFQRFWCWFIYETQPAPRGDSADRVLAELFDDTPSEDACESDAQMAELQGSVESEVDREHSARLAENLQTIANSEDGFKTEIPIMAKIEPSSPQDGSAKPPPQISNELRNSEKERDESHIQLDAPQAQYDSVEKTLEAIITERNKFASDLANTLQKLEKVNSQFTALHENNRISDDQRHKLQRSLTTATARVAQLTTDLGQMRRDLAARTAERNGALCRLGLLEDGTREEFVFEIFRPRVLASIENLTELQHPQDRLPYSMREALERLLLAAEEAGAHRTAHRAEIDTLQGTVSLLEQRIRLLEERETGQVERITELEGLLAQREAHLQAKATEFRQRTEEGTVLSIAAANQISEAADEISFLKRDRDRFLSERDGLKQDLESTIIELNEAHQLLSSSKYQINDSSQSLADAMAARDAVVIDRDQKVEELDRVKFELNTTKSDSVAREQALKTALAARDAEILAIGNVRTELISQESKLQAANETINRLELAIQELETARDGIQKQILALSAIKRQRDELIITRRNLRTEVMRLGGLMVGSDGEVQGEAGISEDTQDDIILPAVNDSSGPGLGRDRAVVRKGAIGKPRKRWKEPAVGTRRSVRTTRNKFPDYVGLGTRKAISPAEDQPPRKRKISSSVSSSWSELSHSESQ